MQQYYDGDYWKLSLEERVRTARARMEEARARVDATRARLAELPESTTYVVEKSEGLSPASAYQAADPRMRAMAGPPPRGRVEALELVVRHDTERKLLWRRYLLDFQHYITLKLEHDRLEAELSRTRLLAPENRPHGQSGPDRRGPVGSPSVSPVTEPDPMAQYREEALRRMKQATERLKRERSDEAVRETLTEAANAQWAGITEGPDMDDAFDAVGDVVEEQRDKAKDRFMKLCTAENYRSWLSRRADGQVVGRDEPDRDPLAGVRRLRPPGPYEIQLGDTLSKLAKEFYGQESLWYVIYERNMGGTPDNPNLILPGLTLEIP